MSDLSAVHTILHHQNFEFLDVVNEELLEAGWEHMESTLVGTVTNIWHQVLALEATTYSVVNTFWFTPFVLNWKNAENINNYSLVSIGSVIVYLPTTWHNDPIDGG